MTDALCLTAFDQRFPEALGSPGNVTLDDSGDGIGVAFQAFTADAITHLGFRYGARTGTPPTYIAGLQGITAGGLPDGTYKGGGTPASVTFTPPADASIDGLWQWYQLDNAYTPSRGELMTAIIIYSSGTIDASNNSSWTRTLPGLGSSTANGLPLMYGRSASAWAKGTFLPIFGIRTASGRYGFIYQSAYTTNIATTGERSTMKFNLASGWGSTYQLRGAFCRFRNGATGATTFKFGLWNAAGTELASTTYDVDYIVTANADNSGVLLFSNATLPTLDFGTDYYIGFESISNSSIGIRGIQLASADDRSAFPNGANRCLSTWNGAAWSDDTTVMPMCSLKFADWTEPAGGGGGGQSALLGGIIQ